MRRRLILFHFASVAAQSCEPNCPYTAHKFLACENRLAESAAPAEGYALAFGPQQIASTRTRFLDGADTEIAKLASGFTIMSHKWPLLS